MRTWILIAMMAIATPALADSTHTTTSGGDVTANGGAGGAGGKGGDGGDAVAFGGQGGAGGSSHSTNVNGNSNDNRSSASNRTDVDASSRNTNTNVNGQKQGQGQGQEQGQLQGQLQGQGQGQGQSTSIDFGTTKVEVAAPAGDVHGMTTGSDATICGVVGGASAQSGLVGAGVSSESFACLAHKHSLYQAEAHSDADRSIENFSWYFPPFMVVRLVRSAIFN